MSNKYILYLNFSGLSILRKSILVWVRVGWVEVGWRLGEIEREKDREREIERE